MISGPVRKNSALERVLVVQMAKLGDMVCTTPIFRAIKKEFPNSFLTVVGNAINKEVLQGNTDVDDYIVFTGIINIYRTLRNGRFDTTILVGPDMLSSALAYISGVPCIIVPRVTGGYSPFESITYRAIRRIGGMIVVDHRMGRYAPREYLRTLEPLGIFTNNTTKHLAYSKGAMRQTDLFFASNEVGKSDIIVGISPSAGNKIKKWGEKKFAELATRLYRTHKVNIVVIGGKRDKEEVAGMLKLIPSGVPIIDASEKFSIDELKALISRMNLFVAVDTGPIYIAEAFGVPTVDIAGPMDEREQPPVGDKHLVVIPSGPRIPQLHIMNARIYDEKEAWRQTESISVDMVYNTCEALL